MADQSAPRIRKAWAVVTTSHGPDDQPSIYYAPTRAKARSLVIAEMRDAWDCTWIVAAEEIEIIRRAPERDEALPPRHFMAPHLGDKLLHVVVHAYGGTGPKAGYRDHFYTTSDDADLVGLVRLGLFEKGPDVPRAMAGRKPCAYFYLTALGRIVAAGEQPEYPRG